MRVVTIRFALEYLRRNFKKSSLPPGSRTLLKRVIPQVTICYASSSVFIYLSKDLNGTVIVIQTFSSNFFFWGGGADSITCNVSYCSGVYVMSHVRLYSTSHPGPSHAHSSWGTTLRMRLRASSTPTLKSSTRKVSTPSSLLTTLKISQKVHVMVKSFYSRTHSEGCGR